MQEDHSKLAKREIPWTEPIALPGYPSANSAWTSPHVRELHLFDYLLTVRKHLALSLSFLLTLVSVVTIATFKMTPVYIATAQVEIDRDSSSYLPFQSGQETDYFYDQDSYMQTQAKVLQSDAVALQTIKSLQLWKYPEFRSTPQVIAEIDNLTDASEPLERPAILTAFLGRLSVKRIPNSNLLEVSFESRDPQLAALIVNKHLQNFIDFNTRTRYESAKRASDWLKAQLADFQSKVEKSEDTQLAYEVNNQIPVVTEGQDLTTQKMGDLNKALTDAQTERMKDEASYEMVKDGQLDALPAVQQDPVLQDLATQQDHLRSDYAASLNKYGPKFPAVLHIQVQLKSLADSIAQRKDKLKQAVVTQYRTAVNHEKLLQAALSEQEAKSGKQAQKMVKYNLLKRETDANTQLYQGLLQKLNEAGLSAGLRSDNLRIVNSAMIPSAPARPQKARDIALAFIVGLVGGIGLAFFREYLDNTVKSPDDIETLTHLPSLAIVPSLSAPSGFLRPTARMLKGGKPEPGLANGQKVALISHDQPQSQIAEAFRALRTSLLLSRAEQPPQVILVTSALPKEGKTTAAVNLAVTLAQLGDRTLLIDSDLRRPGIAKLLGLSGPSRVGLSSYLAGACALEGCTYPCPSSPELSVIPAGPIPPNPADLLSSQRLVDAIEHLRQQYKFIVVDSPPIMLATDAVIVSTWVDGVLLVARSGETPKAALMRTHDLLGGVKCRLLGVILNAVNTSAPDYYYRYYPYYGEYYSAETSETPGAEQKQSG